MATVNPKEAKSKTINLTPEQVLKVKCREFAQHAKTKAEADAEMKRLSEEIHAVVAEHALPELFKDKNGKETKTAKLEGVKFGYSESTKVKVDSEKYDEARFFAAFPSIHAVSINASKLKSLASLDRGKELEMEEMGVTYGVEEAFKVSADK